MDQKLARLTESPFYLFALIGFGVNFAIFQLLLNWMKFFAILLNKPHLGYHELPAAVHYAGGLLPWAVLVVLGLITILDVYRRDFRRSLGYVAGIVAAAILTVSILFVQIMAVSSEF